MLHLIRNRRVLYITTQKTEHIRNRQELALLAEHAASYTVLASEHSSWLRRLLSVYRRLLALRIGDYDTVFLGMLPQLILPLWGWKFKNQKIVEDFFISPYDMLCCDGGSFRADSAIGRLLRRLDEKALLSADSVVCDTHANGQRLASAYGVDADRLITMYLSADTDIYRPVTVARPASLQDKCIVLYFGSILQVYGIDVVYDTFRLLENYANLQFICINSADDAKTPAPRPQAANIQYIDHLPEQELVRYIAMADLCLAGSFQGASGRGGRTISMQALICREMKKPMILGDTPANHELFRADCNTIFVEAGNAHALANGILSWMRKVSKKECPSSIAFAK